MKIGILTFHWATNHGAVLQAYALSEYLSEYFSAEVEIINYCPKKYEINLKNCLKLRYLKSIKIKVNELIKESKIKTFRNKLKLSKRFYTNTELINAKMNYDILITGSDQIWNPYYLLNGEGRITPVYFLNFGDNNIKKISVSASFGCEVFPENCQHLVKDFLKEYNEISVRENTGRLILSNMGINAIVTADPTSLLSRDKYLDLCPLKNNRNSFVSKMILRKQTKEVNRLIQSICDFFSSHKKIDICNTSIPEWISVINQSKLVITNSFHCVMMCLKLHTQFVVVLEHGKNSGMNDRFFTLLEIFGLKDRIISTFEDFNNLSDINYSNIDSIMDSYADSLKSFLERNIC